MPGQIILPNTTTPSNPPANTKALFNDNINGMCVVDDAGVVTVLGTGSATPPNYITSALLSLMFSPFVDPVARAQCATIIDQTVSCKVAAAGTTRADATPITAPIAFCNVCAGPAGLLLPANTTAGQRIIVLGISLAANAPQIYAPASETIDGIPGATGKTINPSGSGDAFILEGDGVGNWGTLDQYIS